MKRLFAGVLVACSAVGGEPIFVAPSPVAVALPDAEGGSAEEVADASPDAGVDVAPIVDSGRDGPSAYDACKATACAARCGVLPEQCEGRVVDCGSACPVAYDRCGDSVANQCSHVCLDQGNDDLVCAHFGQPGPGQLAFQPRWAADYACRTAPYGGQQGLAPRPGGLTDCVYREYLGVAVWCCP